MLGQYCRKFVAVPKIRSLQSGYACSAKPSLNEHVLLLTVNCRNTNIIHDATYHYYAGTEMEPPSIEGSDRDDRR